MNVKWCSALETVLWFLKKVKTKYHMIYKFYFWVCNIGLAKKLGVFYNRL